MLKLAKLREEGKMLDEVEKSEVNWNGWLESKMSSSSSSTSSSHFHERSDKDEQ